MFILIRNHDRTVKGKISEAPSVGVRCWNWIVNPGERHERSRFWFFNPKDRKYLSKLA